MSNPQSDAELTPEAKVIIGRARQSFLFSIGILIVGFIVIGGALVYRSMQVTPAAPAPASVADYSIASVKLPAGAQLVSASADGGMVTVTYRVGANTSIRILDGSTGEIVREIPVVSE
ncbi:MAG: hypothetical protein ABL879_07865 [Devosia sp.]